MSKDQSLHAERAREAVSSASDARHEVQFYRDEWFLVRTVAAFVLQGLQAGDGVVILATRDHLDAIRAILGAKNVDGKRVIERDASAMVSRVIVEGVVDQAAFKTVVGGLISQGRASSVSGRIRAYGELVDVLSASGNMHAAIELEDLWCGLTEQHGINLLCAYDMNGFASHDHTQEFEKVCDRHRVVTPTERVAAKHAERDREIAALEQRAAALEAEVALREHAQVAFDEMYRAERSARRDAEHRKEEGDVLCRLAQAANAADTFDAIFEPALEAVCALLSVERAAILLLDDGVMRFKAARGLSEEYQRAVEGHSPWNGDDATPRPIWVRDVMDDTDLARFQPLFEQEEIAALGFIPLIQQGTLLGKFMVYEAVPRAFSAHEEQLAVTVASEVAQAVARGRLIAAERRSWQYAADLALQASRLHTITAALSRAATLSEVCLGAVTECMEAVGATTAGLWLVNRERGLAELQANRGYSEQGAKSSQILPLDGPLDLPVLTAIRSGRAIWIESRRELEEQYPELGKTAVLRPECAVAALPLLLKGECIGALAFTFIEAHHFFEDEQHFLLVLTQHAAQAVERARLFEQERRARAESEAAYRRAGFLLEASVLLSSSLDFRETLNRLSALSVPRICDWCVIEMTPHRGQDAHVMIAHSDPSKVEAARADGLRFPPRPDAEHGAARVMRTGKSELYSEITDEHLVALAQSEDHLRLLRESGMCAALIAPIAARDRTFGTITFVSAESGRRFESADRDLAELLGRRAGIAVDNALLYEAAQRATRAREDVLAVVSHDLRTPLGVVMMGAAHLVSENLSSPDAHKAAVLMHRSAGRMARMINDLLDFSSIEGDHLTIEPGACEPNEIIAATSEMFTAPAAERNLKLTVQLSEGLPTLHCDRDRMVQALGNLVSNAVKITPLGGVVCIGAEQRETEVVFLVEDSGPGIPSNQLTKVFDRYWRSEHATYRGTGLGLTIAKGIVDAHRGRIWVESEVGAGSRFMIGVPLQPVIAS